MIRVKDRSRFALRSFMLLVLWPGIAVSQDRHHDRPNVILILTDDEITLHRWAPYLGKAMGITKARLVIGTIDKEITVANDDARATFRVTLNKGPARLQTWLTRSDGKQHGAYYTRVEYLSH